MKMTTIAVTRKTRDKLCEYGRKGESYDTIIRKLMKEARQNKILKQDKFVPSDKL